MKEKEKVTIYTGCFGDEILAYKKKHYKLITETHDTIYTTKK